MTNTFNDLYVHELELIASAEKQMVDLLPLLTKATDTAELTRALEQQRSSCRERFAAMQDLLKLAGGKARIELGTGMQALLAECQVLLKEFPDGNLRDAVLIAHLQRAEHYKIAAYASLRGYAKLLGDKEAVGKLEVAAKEVSAASKNLEQIAIQVDAEAYVDTRVEES